MAAIGPAINDTIVPDIPPGVLQVASPEQDPDSHTPLLIDNGKDDGVVPWPTQPAASHPKRRKTYLVIFLVVLAAILLDIATYVSIAPLLRVYESIICRSYYKENDPSFLGPGGFAKEEDCKNEEVQGELAMFRGWQTFCESVPGILFAIPYGVLADRIGRKPIIILSLGGVCLYSTWILVVCWFPDVFNIWWMLYGTAFQILGGGSTTASSVIFTVLADVVSADQRSTLFAQVSAAIMIAAFVSYPVSSALMLRDPWIPLYIALSFFFVGTFALFFLPETLNWHAMPPEIGGNEETESSNDSNCETDSIQTYGTKSSFNKMTAQIVQELRDTGIVFSSAAVSVLTITVLIASVGRASFDLLMQYASTRFQWSIAKASLLLALQAGIAVAVLLLVLPVINRLLTSRFSLHANIKDLHITRYSLLLIIVGLFGVGFSFSPVTLVASIVIFALGQGFSASLRSLTTSFVAPNQVGRIYAVQGVVQMIGPLIAGPTLPKAYKWGLKLGGLWDGLPFLIAATMHVIFAIPLFMLQLGGSSWENEMLNPA